MLRLFGMKDCKPNNTSFDVNCKLVKLMNEENAIEAQSMEEMSYKQVVGSLMYVMIGIG